MHAEHREADSKRTKRRNRGRDRVYRVNEDSAVQVCRRLRRKRFGGEKIGVPSRRAEGCAAAAATAAAAAGPKKAYGDRGKSIFNETRVKIVSYSIGLAGWRAVVRPITSGLIKPKRFSFRTVLPPLVSYFPFLLFSFPAPIKRASKVISVPVGAWREFDLEEAGSRERSKVPTTSGIRS